METPYSLEERAFREIKRLCYAGLDARALRLEVAEVLRRVVPFDRHCLFTSDPWSGLPTDVVVERVGEEEMRFFLENVMFEDGVNTYDWMVRSRRPVALLSEGTGGRLERALRYREILAPNGFGYELRSVFAVGRLPWGGAELARERGRSDFDAREVAFVRRVAPHLGAGLKAAVLREQALPEAEGGNVSGVLTLDRRMRVIQHTKAAEDLLREIGDLGPGWLEGEGLPAVVCAVVGALRSALDPGAGADGESAPRVCVRARSGRWMTLQADLTEPTGARPSEVVVVIEPAGPKEVGWLHMAAYGLSPREREIVELIVRGAQNREIAAALYISEYTVQDHLKSIFEKVGVRGRGALVKKLFLGTIFS
ncbi:helix-turn-helix transcriptional regulator [Rubrobacter taiwanensis]|jgi:DNA-binding CsgD family transcriptional regulator|uniref:Helix-turn-helix transcriptional regulator n=1 Tax=Rubrobacter taiwanensis TaxID=185139 RepID=A0A4R1BAB2_9ACTN|nr:LuxR C-terminal-related transcriptional regulator [Rubrobacter taiwanensis]TCJ13896.1 helix-turn-helix transcriptional regulator [Rubrobacter taiwanensis]